MSVSRETKSRLSMVITALIALIGVMAIASVPIKTVSSYECPVCREQKVVTESIWGSASTNYSPSAFSDYYAGNFPDHLHRFIGRASTSKDIFGGNLRFANKGRLPIFRARPESQLEFLTNNFLLEEIKWLSERAADPSVATAIVNGVFSDEQSAAVARLRSIMEAGSAPETVKPSPPMPLVLPSPSDAAPAR